MRTKVIPATICGVLGAVVLAGSLFALAYLAWFNIAHGPVAPSPETEALNQLALTVPNVARWLCGLFSGVLGICSAVAWMKNGVRTASVLTLLYAAASGAYVALSVALS